MAKTASDQLFERLLEWGVDTVFGIPGDGINGFMEGPAEAPREDPVRPGPARGGRGVRRVRLRQVHRAAGRLHRHQRPRRHPSAQRPLRRQDGQHPRPGDHRADLSRPDGDAVPAGGRPPQPVQGRGGLQPADHGPQARPRTGRRRLPRGAVARGVAHLNCPNDWQDLTGEEASPMNEAGHTSAPPGRRRSSSRRRPSLETAAALLNAGKRTVILVGQGARGAGDDIERMAEALAAPRSSRPCSARPSSPTTRPYHDRRPRPARHAPVREGDGGVRHPAAGRHQLPVHELPAQAGPGEGRPDRPRSATARPPLPDRHRPRRRRAGDARGPPPAAQAARRTARSWRRLRSG